MAERDGRRQAAPDSTLGSLVGPDSHPDLIRISGRAGGLNAITIRELAGAPRDALTSLGEMRGMDPDLCDELLSRVSRATGVRDLARLADWVVAPGWSNTPLHAIARDMPHATRIRIPLEAHSASAPGPTAGDALREPEATLARVIAAGVPRSIASDVMTRVREIIGIQERRPDDSDSHAGFLQRCRDATGGRAGRWETVAAMCGFGGERPVLPDDVAATKGVTRSRAHQWKDSALKMIRATPALQEARELLGDGGRAFRAISSGEPAIGLLSDRNALRRLSPVQILCILITHDNVRSWLDSHARHGGGWIAPGLPSRRVASAARSLRTSEGLKRPIPYGRIGRSPEAAQAAAILSGEPTQCGHIGTNLPRQARAARLHSVAEDRDWPCFDIRDLASAYWRENPSDAARARNIQIALKGDGPHLFLQVLDDIWMRLDAIGRPVQALRRVPHATGEDDDPDDNWVGAWMEKVKPPKTADPVVKRPEWPWVWTPGIILPEYERPGDHPLHDRWRSIEVGSRSALGYSLAMRSGAPGNLFRPWCPAYERAYAEAAREAGDGDLVDSILAHARVAEWPGTKAEIAAWSERALGARWPTAVGPIPSVRHGEETAIEALRALAWTWCFGTIGAPVCAHIRGRSIAGTAGLPLLRALARAGALERPEDETLAWTKGPAFQETIEAMRKHVGATGTAEWGDAPFSAVGRGLREGAGAGDQDAQCDRKDQ